MNHIAKLNEQFDWSGHLLEAEAPARLGSTMPDIKPAIEPTQPEVYVSYSHARESQDPLVGELCDSMAEQGLHICRDSTDQQPGDKISHFMGHLSAGWCVVVVLSEAYLHSEFCMIELYQIYTNARQKGR